MPQPLAMKPADRPANDRRVTAPDILRRITEALLNDAVSADEVLAIVVHGVKQYLAVDVCSVYLLDAAGNCILIATDGLDPRAVGASRFAQHEGLVGLVLEGRQPVSLKNAQEHPRFKTFPEFGGEVYRAFLGVPIVHRHRALGVLLVRQTNDREFVAEDETFLVTVATQIAGLVHAETIAAGMPVGRGRQAASGVLNGLKGAPGVGIGLGTLPSPAADIDSVPERQVEDAGAEEDAFRQAVAAVRAELRASGERLAARMTAEAHAMFRAYAELLDDDHLIADTVAHIRAGSWAPGALRRTITKHARIFEQMADPYLRARAEDIRGLGRRILLQLQSGRADRKEYPEQCVLLGEEISIARIADVPIGQLAGIVCTRGSPFSHAAILARILGIPAVMELGDLPLDRFEGRRLLVDGNHGRVFVEPSLPVLEAFQHLATDQEELAAELQALRDLPAETPDGARVLLEANAGLPSDLDAALKSGAEGIGLYRTEFTFITHDSFPSEDEQYRTYRAVLASFAPRPVTMRTLDVGGDKRLPYFPIEEDNASLGWRGIRLTLDNPGIFLTQLRALLRANARYANLRLLLPMIGSPREVDEVYELLDRAWDALRKEGQAAAMPSVGAMVEVPSAIYQMEALAKRVDFFSVGTNDLTQYILAVDRNNVRVSRYYDSLHPAVLRAIDHAVRQARALGTPISVCGEMAGDPASAVLLLGMGINALSMAAPDIPRVKQTLRGCTHQRAQELLAAATAAESPDEVRQILEAALGKVDPRCPAPRARARREKRLRCVD